MGQFDNIKSKEHRHVRRTPLVLTVPAAGRRQSASFFAKSSKDSCRRHPFGRIKSIRSKGIPLGE